MESTNKRSNVMSLQAKHRKALPPALARGGGKDIEFSQTIGVQEGDPGYPIPKSKRQKAAVEEVVNHSEDLADFY